MGSHIRQQPSTPGVIYLEEKKTGGGGETADSFAVEHFKEFPTVLGHEPRPSVKHSMY